MAATLIGCMTNYKALLACRHETGIQRNPLQNLLSFADRTLLDSRERQVTIVGLIDCHTFGVHVLNLLILFSFKSEKKPTEELSES